MNKYLCFYKGKKFAVDAETTLKARDKAVYHFKAKKAHDVSVMLIELGGSLYTHSGASL
jgi:hypothetical protein